MIGTPVKSDTISFKKLVPVTSFPFVLVEASPPLFTLAILFIFCSTIPVTFFISSWSSFVSIHIMTAKSIDNPPLPNCRRRIPRKFWLYLTYLISLLECSRLLLESRILFMTMADNGRPSVFAIAFRIFSMSSSVTVEAFKLPPVGILSVCLISIFFFTINNFGAGDGEEFDSIDSFSSSSSSFEDEGDVKTGTTGEGAVVLITANELLGVRDPSFSSSLSFADDEPGVVLFKPPDGLLEVPEDVGTGAGAGDKIVDGETLPLFSSSVSGLGDGNEVGIEVV